MKKFIIIFGKAPVFSSTILLIVFQSYSSKVVCTEFYFLLTFSKVLPYFMIDLTLYGVLFANFE